MLRSCAYYLVSILFVGGLVGALLEESGAPAAVLPLAILVGVIAGHYWLKHADVAAAKERAALRLVEERELERLRHGRDS